MHAKRQAGFCCAALCLAAMAVFVCTLPVAADEFVSNGDFETDVDLWVTWPGYAAGGSNPPDITDWMGSGGRGINPTQPGELFNPPTVQGWIGGPTANHGINPVNTENDPNPDHQANPAPFRDNGNNDTTAAFMQITQFMQQNITGLVPGTNYMLSLEYNSRTASTDNPLVELTLNGTKVETFPDPDMFPDGIVLPVGDGSDWYTAEIPYTATGTNLLLKLLATPAVGGDSTFLFDNVSLVPAAGGDNLVVNGDFETDPDLFVQWPGYVGSEAQLRPFNDNGNNRTGIAFMQGAAQIDQEVSGLTVGKEYILSLNFNARNCLAGGLPGAELDLDFEPLEDFPGAQFQDGLVTPVGGDNDWYYYETAFVAADTSINLSIKSFANGDSTLLVDNVSVRTKTAGLPGDFNLNGIYDTGDIDILTTQSASGNNLKPYDLNKDNLVNGDDVTVWAKDLADTWIGDANYDREFNSNDFVSVFVQGKYELDVAAVWSEGDWNGDGRFNSSDFVASFVDGGYELGPPPAAVSAVPEPASWVLLLLAGLACLSGRCRRA